MKQTRDVILEWLRGAPHQEMRAGLLHSTIRYRPDARKVLRQMVKAGEISLERSWEPGQIGRPARVYRLVRR